MPQTPEERADFWRKATFWVGGIGILLTLAAIVVAIWAVIDARENAQKIVDAVKRENVQLAQQAAAERAEKERLGKISPDRLLYEYNVHLTALQKAAAAYAAAKSLPPTSEGAAAKKAEAERQLYVAVDAFTTFITRWRRLEEALNKLLDGNADRMDQARQHRNPEDVRDALEILIRTFPDLKQALDAELARIASG